MSEQDILAVVRTLLALERNYLALERTALAELRTGITLVVIGPSGTTVLAYVLPLFHIIIRPIVEWIAYAFLVVITLYGLLVIYHAYRELKNTKNVLQRIRLQELDFAKKSAALNLLLKEILASPPTSHLF
ncbi:MAG: hypothetical protein QG670_2848 [Thermoproteota archaeon]|nr:hypothetical protein [Thermoproteota archaeon]